ncbi:MAG: hypothetical protein FVQ84_09590 [Planctomycetes bacterium]|nr:hypothetical protein [Planctomycetota bacterium]
MDKNENIEMAETEERKPARNWKESKVIFLVLPIILIVLVPLGGFPYLCGRLNYPLTLACMFYPIAFIFLICCFVTGIGRFFRDRREHSGKKKLLIIAQIGISIVVVVLFIEHYFIPREYGIRPPTNPFTYGFRDRIRSKADIKAIRDWMRTLDKEDYDESGVRLPRDEWPKSLKVLKPPSVDLYTDDNGNPKVRIVWGGGFFHWGVEIGMEDMVIPPSDFNHMDEYWLLVETGVYVWDQG